MSKRTLILSLLFCAFLSPLFTSLAWGQLTSTPQIVALAATKQESLSVTITTPGPVNFTLTGGTNDPGSAVPAWTTNWNLKPQRNTLNVCVYLSGNLNGTGGNTDNIPPDNVLGLADGTGTPTPLNSTAWGASNGLQIWATAINNSNRVDGSHGNSVALQINDSTLTLSPDTYSGTLNIIAQAP